MVSDALTTCGTLIVRKLPARSSYEKVSLHAVETSADALAMDRPPWGELNQFKWVNAAPPPFQHLVPGPKTEKRKLEQPPPVYPWPE